MKLAFIMVALLSTASFTVHGAGLESSGNQSFNPSLYPSIKASKHGVVVIGKSSKTYAISDTNNKKRTVFEYDGDAQINFSNDLLLTSDHALDDPEKSKITAKYLTIVSVSQSSQIHTTQGQTLPVEHGSTLTASHGKLFFNGAPVQDNTYKYTLKDKTLVALTPEDNAIAVTYSIAQSDTASTHALNHVHSS
ncbi:hypothetical protein [Aquirhabdus parva]|uniref:Uncharacterized protein n=1 Tax=Aquirhabdus parva TaxID=2283318 RepID=A0A345P9C9_9GAMM|nr:hypothetical protein [Aquirhabdus parva]AXI03888.1 hypothetical protein HYN46_14200 [Aquirhabdus parva]